MGCGKVNLLSPIYYLLSRRLAAASPRRLAFEIASGQCQPNADRSLLERGPVKQSVHCPTPAMSLRATFWAGW